MSLYRLLNVEWQVLLGPPFTSFLFSPYETSLPHLQGVFLAICFHCYTVGGTVQKSSDIIQSLNTKTCKDDLRKPDGVDRRWACPNTHTCVLGHFRACAHDRKCVQKTVPGLKKLKARYTERTINTHYI